ncbi:hypothetical protein Esti_001729 [Eimeria stiedai]
MFHPAAGDPNMGHRQQQQQQQQVQQQPSEELQQLQLLFAGRSPGASDPLQQQQQQEQQQEQQQQQRLGSVGVNASNTAAAAAQQYLAASSSKNGGVGVSGLGLPLGSTSTLPFGSQQNLGAPPPSSVGGPSRLLLFVDRPTRPFALQDGDIRSCVASYGPIDSVTILCDHAAAEIAFVSAAACAKELDGIHLKGVGILRAVLLPSGVSAAAALPESASDPPRQQQQQQQYSAPAEGPPPQWLSGPLGGPPPQDARHLPPGDSAGYLLQQQQAAQQQLQQLGGSSSSSVRRVCRLELVGLFSEEPAFSIAAAIRGPGDSNIKFILEQTKHKVDLGIRGKPVNEAPVADRLHVTLASEDAEAFDKGLVMTEDLVQSVCDQFMSYCRDRQFPLPPSLGFRRHMYQQQMDLGGPGLPGPLIYLGASERFRTAGGGVLGVPSAGGGPQQQTTTQAVSPAAAANAAAAAAAVSAGGGALLPPLLPPGVVPPGPLPLAALAAATLSGAPFGPLVPPGALGAAGVLGPPPFLGTRYRGPDAEYDEATLRERSRSRERGRPRDRWVVFYKLIRSKGGPPLRGGAPSQGPFLPGLRSSRQQPSHPLWISCCT